MIKRFEKRAGFLVPMRAFVAFVLAVVLACCSGCSTGADADGIAGINSAASASAAGQLEGAAGTGDIAGGDAGSNDGAQAQASFSIEDIPSYVGSAYVVIDDNEPSFADEVLEGSSAEALGNALSETNGAYEVYSDLDSLGRCGTAEAVVGEETMPTEERGSIGMVKPSGWHTVRYDDLVDGKYLYNRCHLIGYQLTGENANEENLVTGTRYMNTEGMLPFEDEVADYVEETGNHVLYCSTPVFVGDELVARGVHLEALSVEDGGSGVRFNVFCYNVQPGVEIDYATGDSWRTEEESSSAADSVDGSAHSATSAYVLNTSSKKFHRPDCASVGQMKDANKREFTGTRDDLMAQGYDPCGRCNP